MRKLFLAVLVVAVAIVATVQAARVGVAGASNAAQVTVGTSSCGLLDSNYNCVVAPYHDVSNNGGIEVERLSADGVFNDTGKAVNFNYANLGLRCQSDVTGAITTNWQETLSASGHASFVCKFNSY